MQSDISIRSVTPPDFPALRILATDIFTRKEPMTSYLKISADEFQLGYDQLSSQMDLQTSSVAHLPNGEIVACLLTVDLNVPFDMSKLSSTSKPVFKLLGELDDWFKAENDLCGKNSDKRVMHIVVGATADAYEGRGISKRLRAETIRKAREFGWDMAVVECTNVKTQHLMRDVFNFHPGLEIRFSDIEVDGKRPMEGLAGSAILLYTDFKK
ncbi:hypothetical protein BJ165DRAFT_1466115 [Panaeolus papilionaceus]|nr:hypothetical protein BJ165DRAFT_1466115 [Panaeolus papilionaceus]